MSFQGLSEETYRFFWEIALKNDITFFEENKKRYEDVVKNPIMELAAALEEAVLKLDANFQTRPSAVVSRIRRDTRYAPVDAPFRDNTYLAYKYPGKRIGESFTVYVEFARASYTYGMGMYSDNPTFMADLRDRILARQKEFLQIANEVEFIALFTLEGPEYKKPKCPDAPIELWPWLNKKKFTYYHTSDELSNTYSPDFVREIEGALQIMKPMYRFIMNLPEK